MIHWKLLDDKLYIYLPEKPEQWFDYQDFDLEGQKIIHKGLPRDIQNFLGDIF
jgi:hypothetical protein